MNVLDHDTMCGPPQDQCVNIVSSSLKSCPPFADYCGAQVYNVRENRYEDVYAPEEFCCVCVNEAGHRGGTTIEVCSWDTTSFTADLSLWNVQGVTDMSGAFLDMFEFNSDLSKWNVSGVTDMRNMFRNAVSFNSDLSRWNVQKVVDMDGIFDGATSLDVCNRGSICRSWGSRRPNDCETTTS